MLLIPAFGIRSANGGNMLRIVTVPLVGILLTIPALAADEWSGRLVDANCTHRNGGPQACDPGINTTSFGLVVAGEAFLFDNKGNRKAAEAIKHRADSSAAVNKKPSSEVTASVTGAREGESHKILVKTIVLD
jgi:hypothetical protein